MAYGSLGAHIEELRSSHAHADGLAALEAAGVDGDFFAGKKLAHGQRFEPSLAVPLLDTVHADEVVRRNTGERRPRGDVVGLRDQPSEGKRAFFRRFPDELPRSLGLDG